MVNRKPNTTCHVCAKPIYRRPSQVARQNQVFCSTACRNTFYPNKGRKGVQLFGPDNPCWRGGSYIEPEKGYRMVRCPPEFASMARQNGYVLDHRLVMARHLSRPLRKEEVVHHINHDLLDNQIENLKLYRDHQEHYSIEHAAEIGAENSRTGRSVPHRYRH